MADNKKPGKGSQGRPGKRGNRGQRPAANPPTHPSRPARQNVTGSGQSVQQQLRRMSELAREATIASADAQAASQMTQSNAAKAHSAANRSKTVAQSLESAAYSLEQALAVDSTRNHDGVPSTSTRGVSPRLLLDKRDIKMEIPSDSDNKDFERPYSYRGDEEEDVAEYEQRPSKRHRPTEARGSAASPPSKRPRTTEARESAASPPGVAAPGAQHTSSKTKLCWLMGPERKGLPPIYTKAVCINELASRLGKPLDDLPWSVGHSTVQWHTHSQLFSRSMDYAHNPQLPDYTAEMHRSIVTGPQTLHSRPPLHGDIDSLIKHLGSTTVSLDH
ncbi:hypothetical protein PG984_008145 [Apiospora sp. TS-2023a]